jgi:chemotaxis protein CheD
MASYANHNTSTGKHVVVVGMAELGTAKSPSSELAAYFVGSGLAVIAFDQTQKIGGIIHALLPDSKVDPAKARQKPQLFVDTAIPLLIDAMIELGAKPETLSLKISGGAQFLDEKTIFNIGERNLQAAKSSLAENSFSPQCTDVGGKYSRTVRLDVSTGQVTIQSPGSPAYTI